MPPCPYVVSAHTPKVCPALYTTGHWGGAELETSGLQKLCQSGRGQMDIRMMTRQICARGIRKSTPGIRICVCFSCTCGPDKEFPGELWWGQGEDGFFLRQSL